jgi:hypothetical protein
VASLTGSSPAPGQVQLSWNPGDVHAEAFFDVYRWGTDVGNVEKNGSGISLYGQPSGSQRYYVYGYTNALEDPWGDDPLPGPVDINVLPPVPSPPAAVTLSGSNGTGTVSWNSVSGATSYRVQVGRYNGGDYIIVRDWVVDDASPFSFSYMISDDYHAAVKACNDSGCSDPRDCSPYWVALGPRTTNAFLFGPAPAIISDEQGRYLWLLGTVKNPEVAAQQVIASSSATGHPSGCGQIEQLILPGSEQFTLSAGEEKWLIYRFRYECHSPAHSGTYSMPIQLCVRRVGGGSIDHCRAYVRSLITK